MKKYKLDENYFEKIDSNKEYLKKIYTMFYGDTNYTFLDRKMEIFQEAIK